MKTAEIPADISRFPLVSQRNKTKRGSEHTAAKNLMDNDKDHKEFGYNYVHCSMERKSRKITTLFLEILQRFSHLQMWASLCYGVWEQSHACVFALSSLFSFSVTRVSMMPASATILIETECFLLLKIPLIAEYVFVNTGHADTWTRIQRTILVRCRKTSHL